jgi:creatinine amidohydrolase
MPILNIVARRTVLETEALCAAFIWPSIIPDAVKQVRESPRGGMAHACELETSLYLHLNKDAVQMDKAVADYHEHKSEFHWQDLQHGAKIVFMDWWSRISETGTVGDPTLATAEKGRVVYEASVSELIKLVREFREWSSMPRRDLH